MSKFIVRNPVNGKYFRGYIDPRRDATTLNRKEAFLFTDEETARAIADCRRYCENGWEVVEVD